MPILLDARRRQISRLSTLDRIFDRHAIQGVRRRAERSALQEGIVSALWQCWCSFSLRVSGDHEHGFHRIVSNDSEDSEQRFQAIVSTFWRCRTLRPTTQPGYGFLIQPMRKPDAHPEIVDAPDKICTKRTSRRVAECALGGSMDMARRVSASC
jgi:hypothetical protein